MNMPSVCTLEYYGHGVTLYFNLYYAIKLDLLVKNIDGIAHRRLMFDTVHEIVN